jgi:hypothetical protein
VPENAYDRPDLVRDARALVIETADALASGTPRDVLLEALYFQALRWASDEQVTEDDLMNEPAATMANVIVAAGQIIAELVPETEEEMADGQR